MCACVCVFMYHPHVQVPPLRRLARRPLTSPNDMSAPLLCSPLGAKITLRNVNRLPSKHTAFCGPSPASVSKFAPQTGTVPFWTRRPRLMARIRSPGIRPVCHSRSLSKLVCLCLGDDNHIGRLQMFHATAEKEISSFFFFSSYLISPFHFSRQMGIHTNSLGV